MFGLGNSGAATPQPLDEARSSDGGKQAGRKAEAEKPRRRAKRKVGTWADVAGLRPRTGRDPPPG
jgi:hypothetical protein